MKSSLKWFVMVLVVALAAASGWAQTSNNAFFMTVSPERSSISSGGTANFKVDTAAVGAFDSDLIVAVTDIPDGATVDFDPSLIAAPGTGESFFAVHAGSMLPGVHFLNVEVTSADGFTVEETTVEVDVDCRAPFLFGTSDVQPSSQTVPAGSSAILDVSAGGSEPFTYQWYVGPTGSIFFPVSGATSSRFVTPPINATTQFWVRVSNPCGTFDSFAATVSPGSESDSTNGHGRVHAAHPGA